MNSKQPLEVEILLPVKTYDIDFAGIVSNIVYIRWLEDLRLEILSRYYPLEEQLKIGIAPVIVQTKIDYKLPIKIFDIPKGRMWLKELSAVRWTVKAEIFVNDKVAAISEQVGIFIDSQTNKPIPIPEKLKQKYHE